MDIDSILKMVNDDPGLGLNQKQELTQEKNKLEKVLSSAAGATLALAIGKYLKLSHTSQLLVGAAGAGIGVLVYDYVNRPRFANYNETSRAYEIDSKRF